MEKQEDLFLKISMIRESVNSYIREIIIYKPDQVLETKTEEVKKEKKGKCGRKIKEMTMHRVIDLH